MKARSDVSPILPPSLRLGLPYSDVVAGFADTLLYARQMRPDLANAGNGDGRRKTGLGLVDLVATLGVDPTGGAGGAHNSLFDADNLR